MQVGGTIANASPSSINLLGTDGNTICSGIYVNGAAMFEALVVDGNYEEFLTLPAYRRWLSPIIAVKKKPARSGLFFAKMQLEHQRPSWPEFAVKCAPALDFVSPTELALA